MPRSSRWSVAGVVVLSLGTLAGLNYAAGALLDRAGRNLALRLMDEKWKMVLAPGARAEPAPWLILGDSSGNQGVDPEVLGEALTTDPAMPARALNLCVVADTLVVHDAWMLGEWIERHGPPAGVVVVHTYDIWFRESDHPEEPNSAIMLSQVPIPLWEWPLDPPVTFTGANRAAFYVSRYVPLYAEETTLRELIEDPGLAVRRLRDGGDIAWQWPREDGFMPLANPREQAVLNDTRGHLNFLRPRREGQAALPFRPSADSLAGLERLSELAEEHGFDVYLVAGPMYRGLWEEARMRAYHAELREWLAGVDAEHERLHVALAEPVVFEAGQMQNADHVTAEGARVYSRAVGEAIRRVRDGAGGIE